MATPITLTIIQDGNNVLATPQVRHLDPDFIKIAYGSTPDLDYDNDPAYVEYYDAQNKIIKKFIVEEDTAAIAALTANVLEKRTLSTINNRLFGGFALVNISESIIQEIPETDAPTEVVYDYGERNHMMNYKLKTCAVPPTDIIAVSLTNNSVTVACCTDHIFSYLVAVTISGHPANTVVLSVCSRDGNSTEIFLDTAITGDEVGATITVT